MKAVRADDRVEGIFREGEILAVTHHKFGVGKLFGLSDVDHLGSQIEADIVFLRVFFMKQLDHRSGSAAAVEDIVKRFFLQFCQIFDSIQGFFFGIVMGGQKKIIFFIAEIHGDPSSGLFIYHTSDQKNMQ